MSHRAEEKERRRQERMAAEEEARKQADRRKRLGLVGGVALVAAVAVFVVFVVAGGGGDDGDGGGGSEAAANVEIPAQQIDNLREAARAANCTVTEHKLEGAEHTTEKVEYETNPPTSGDHDPTPAEDGIYAAENPPDIEQSVHSLEHGRVHIQYKPGTPQEQIDQLETVADEEVKGTELYHTLVYQNQTGMEPAIVATAWRNTLACETFNDKIFDAIRAFRRDRIDKGPEFVP
jgi:Protein of unknown function (DUF3105)